MKIRYESRWCLIAGYVAKKYYQHREVGVQDRRVDWRLGDTMVYWGDYDSPSKWV